MWTHIPLLIHLSLDGHFDCSQLLETLGNVAVNFGVQLSEFLLPFFFVYIPRSRIAKSNVNAMSHFWKNQHTIFHSSCIILHSCQQYTRTRIPVSPYPNHHWLLFLKKKKKKRKKKEKSHSNGYKVVSYCDFTLISLMIKDVAHLLTSILLTICMSSLLFRSSGHD